MPYIDKISVENEEYQLVGTGEMLPVGTELDIDKNATIPTGWEEIEYDTGWVDIEIDTTKCSISTGGNGSNKYTKFTPQIRRIGNIVYLRGRLEVQKSNIQQETAIILATEPLDNKFLTNACEIDVVTVLDEGVKIYNSYIGSRVRTDDRVGKLCLWCYNTGWSKVPSTFTIQLDSCWAVDELTTKRIRKVSETQVPSIGEVYDDQERVIGTWFGKPLYQKTLYFTNSQFSRANENILNFGIDNIDMVMFHSGIGYRSVDNTYQNILNVHGVIQDWGLGVFNMSRTNFVFWVGKMDGTNRYMLDYVYLTFRYTKTTDSQE